MLAYYLGLGLISMYAVGTMPLIRSLGSGYYGFLQTAFGIGGVWFAYRLSSSKPFLVWLRECGLRSPRAVYVFHGIAVGLGLQYSFRLIFWRDVSLEWNALTPFAAILLMMVIAEDLVFQGMLYPVYRKQFSVGASAMFVGLIATAAHGFNLVPSLAGILVLLIGECVFSLYREYTDTLWATTACHAASNVASSLLVPT